MTKHDAGGPFRIGIVGAGRVVEYVHLPILNRLPQVQVMAIFDPLHERVEQLAAQFNIPHQCHSLEELLQLELDIALVATPNCFHAATSINALEAGMHVLCEKPMALNIQEARSMAETAQRVGKALMVGFANRFRSEIAALHKVTQQGLLGEIKAIRCGWLRRKGLPGSWFTQQDLSGGGALVDLGSHLVDLVTWFMGKRDLLTACGSFDQEVDVSAQARWYTPNQVADADPKCDVEVSASTFAVFEGPLDLFLEVSWACAVPYDFTYLSLQGTRGYAYLKTLFGFSPLGQRPEHPLRIWVEDQQLPVAAFPTQDLFSPYREQWKFFLDSIRHRQLLHSLLHDNLATIQIIEKLYTCMSAETQHGSQAILKGGVYGSF